ncbi:hypothetical protein WR25_05632 [Diploscapter pachys]|uniref:Uncharacterized protein n=1 Tax=Diploscapter pachys TaxID=2018661 RepID=A0A2A2JQW9_9BILA|nr:hypothetical protein WR25_05632 [Diploscapter pachys]
MAVDDKFVPRIVEWEGGGCTVIQGVLENVKNMMSKIKNAQVHHLICLKSNDALEYASIRDVSVSEQLELFRILLESRHSSRMKGRISVSSHSSRGVKDVANRPNASGSNVSENPLILPPTPRSYEIRSGRKHLFPQRRVIVVDFQDPISGISLRAGEIVRACGFSGECYVVENGRRQRAAIPVSFTERSALPPDL